ncbi:hypothetical protein QVD17_00889 [Tagetes erecta]|uniref:Uncharacterized protein n=1 Tax=Tagetes erecta TaxID=13708 RepID=A0AAD8L6L9_TARER|nr:hypothetical protein QVD17_00889 [Tagetes erecta]
MDARSSEIRDPLVRYIHCFFSTGIAARGKSCEHVTKADLFYLYCLLTRRPCALHLCLVDYFVTFGSKQRRGSLYGGSFIGRIAQSVSRLTDWVDLRYPAPAPCKYLDMRSLTGMKVATNFANVGYRFINKNGQIWAWQPLVHQPLLGAEEVQMPQMAEREGEGDDVEVPDEQVGHQHPQRAYRAVRLPRSTNQLLSSILQNQEDEKCTRTSQGRQLDRLCDNIEWMMTGMTEMYKYMNLEVPPRPPPRVYPDQGSVHTQQRDPSMPSSSHQPDTSMSFIPQSGSFMSLFTQHDPYVQHSGPSFTQPDQTRPLFPVSNFSMQAPDTSSTKRPPEFTDEEIRLSDQEYED